MSRKLLILLLVVPGFTSEAIRSEENSAIGKPVRAFTLPDVVTGKEVRLSGFKDQVVVLIFYSHTCTFCRKAESRYRQLAAGYGSKGVQVLAIDSTGANPRAAAAAWQEKKMGFPLLRDHKASTAAALGATALTTVGIVDTRGNLRYLGALDDSESGQEVQSPFVAEALAALLAGKPVQHERTDVYGCLIPLPE